jgi:alpha-glucosidase
VVARWLRPPFDLDGWRMDVAHMTGRAGGVDLNVAVSRAMRRTLQTSKPGALLVAEHPFDAAEVLQGDAYHGTMNYAGFARPVWAWLAAEAGVDFLGMPVPVPHLAGGSVAATMTAVRASAPWEASLHAFNQLGSHDTPRFRSVVGGAATQLAGAGLLFTMPGIPVVFAGDEIGMEGVDHEDARRPMPWDRERWDGDTYDGYRRLIRLRRTHPALRRGGFRWAHVTDDLLCYLRESAEERLLVAVTRAAHPPVRLPADGLGAGEATHLLDGPDLSAAAGALTLPGTEGPATHVWRLAGAPSA